MLVSVLVSGIGTVLSLLFAGADTSPHLDMAIIVSQRQYRSKHGVSVLNHDHGLVSYLPLETRWTRFETIMEAVKMLVE
jgi:hypothetical protein